MAAHYDPRQDFICSPNVEWRSAGPRAGLQSIPRTVSVLRAQFPPSSSTEWHSHPRDELLYTIRGLMTVAFKHETWIVPEGHGILVGAQAAHCSSCPVSLAMCAAYFDPGCLGDQSLASGRLLRVSPLLDACLRALAEEPILYEREGRGGALAKLIAEETRRAPDALFPLPMPADRRLKRLCESLFDTPALGLDIDTWADEVGMSRRSMTRRFRAETGLSFAEWRRRLRALIALSQQARGTPAHLVAKSNGYSCATSLRTMIKKLKKD